MEDQKNNTIALIIPGIITLVASLGLGFLILQATNAQNQTDKDNTRTVAEEVEIESIPFEELVVEDNNLFIDDGDKILQAGINGQIEHTYKVTRDFDGKVIEKEKLSSEKKIEKQDKIIRRGILNREETIVTINERLDAFFRYFQEGDYDRLYPLLSKRDRLLYSREQLKESALKTGFQVESYTENAEIRFIYPSSDYNDDLLLSGVQDIEEEQTQEDDSESSDGDVEEPTEEKEVMSLEELNEVNGLVAQLPISLIFQSSLIGRQKVTLTISIYHEGDNWNIGYFGPTEVIAINKTQIRDDGGKTFGNPLQLELTIRDMVFFNNVEYLYFTYNLKNTSAINTKPELDDRGRETGNFIEVNAASKMTSSFLTDSADTGYEEKENVFFLQTSDVVLAGQEAIGRIVFRPSPGPDIDKIFLSTELMVEDGAFTVQIDFGELKLERQNKFSELQ